MTSPLRAPAATPRAPTEHPRPYLRVAPEPYRRRRTASLVSLAVVVVFGSLLASAVFHAALVRGQLHLDDVQRRTEQTRLDVARDRLRRAELQSPAYLAAKARRMGMVPATEVYAVGSGTDVPVATSTEATPPPGEAEQDTTTTTTTTTTTSTSSTSTTSTTSTSTSSKGADERTSADDGPRGSVR